MKPVADPVGRALHSRLRPPRSAPPQSFLPHLHHRRARVERRLTPLLVALGVLFIAGSPAWGRASDGTLLLSWSRAEAIESGASRIVAAPIPVGELTFWIVGAGRERIASLAQSAPIRVPGIDPGLVRVELRHGMGLLRAWTVLVHADIATGVILDLNLGELAISPVAAEPFGNWETWDLATVRSLPGLADGGVAAQDTRGSSRQDPLLGPLGLARMDRMRPRGIGLAERLVGAQRPLGAAPAHRSGDAGMRLLTRPLPDRRVAIGGSAGNGGRYLGYLEAADRYLVGGSHLLDLGAQAQFSDFDVAGPLEALNASLDHDDERALEVLARASLDMDRAGLWRADFYAAGGERYYHLIEFDEDLDHAPREDRGTLSAALTYDVARGANGLGVELGYRRELTEIGDGEEFDDFTRYTRNANLPPTREDDLYWREDDPTTAIDEGKLFDYYERSLVEDWSARVELTRDQIVPGGFRAGAEIHWMAWRLFEHLRPSNVVSSQGDSGYQLTQNFGYSLDGDSRDDRPGHAARRPVKAALFASQRIPLGSAALEAGARLDRFASGQNPLARTQDPLGRDSGADDPERIDETDILVREDHASLSPRIGLYLPLGADTHVWLDGGRRQVVPPFQALYYDPSFLALQAGLADETESAFASSTVFGNPGLAPEDEWGAQLGLFRQLSANLHVRLAAYGTRTTDTWVVRSYERRLGSIQFYENGGERRELGVHAGTELLTSATSALRVQYDISRRETDVIEPYPLYEHLRLERMPIGNAAVAQTRIRSTDWFDDGVDRGFFPSLLDRTHRLAVSWTGNVSDVGLAGAGARPPRLGIAFRAASGAPYTPTYVRKEGDLVESTDTDETLDPSRRSGDIHSERLPWTWQVDFAYLQPIRVLGRDVDFRIEVRNLTDRQNAQYVYPATGDPDDDGWLDSAEGRQEASQRGGDFESIYREAIESPLHYTEGLVARAGLTVTVF